MVGTRVLRRSPALPARGPVDGVERAVPGQGAGGDFEGRLGSHARPIRDHRPSAHGTQRFGCRTEGGVAALSSCAEGICGTCETEVLDGEPYGTSPRCRNVRIHPVCGRPSALRRTASDAAR
ncbi:2Fe-2S iron-sulfur cluster binding domain-containing protein [Streptomyces sp. NPDC088141]|uniref:2Fe-2S iron-sulfur cluster binding domain-containing protein n=1 Tax=Streptomyces sp. NPDC088141 TaxID=3155179 RepID=UPI00342DABD6